MEFSATAELALMESSVESEAEPKSPRPRMKRTKLLAHRYHRYSLYSSFNVIIKSRATPVAEI